jgi:GTP-binding protein HflX
MIKLNSNNYKQKAIICMLKTNVHDHTIYKIKLEELKKLADTLEIEVVGEVVQSRFKPFSKYLIGSGKVKEIENKIKKLDVGLVIFYNILKSSQKLELMTSLNCEVIDRYELTLEIFDRMASDKLSKLQIQAARMEKMAPFFKLQASINYRHDRPFFRSGGEYGFHGQLRELTRNQARVREEIDKLMEEKSQQIFNRRKLGYPLICIAGYYNAGKTSLFNALTGDNKLVSEKPFTTLTSKYQRRFIDYETTVLFIDTIGFVLDLDPRLIHSFKLNLLDMNSSDIVLLLLELTDPTITLQLKINEGIRLLKDIGVPHERIVLVFNKLDKVPERENEIADDLNLEHYELPWITVSAEKRLHLQNLLELISKRLKTLREHPPKVVELSPLQRAELSINKIVSDYPVEYTRNDVDPFKSLVSTILSQNTNYKNQKTAYDNLEEEVGITTNTISEAPVETIIQAIKPAGMYNQRAKTLKEISNNIMNEYRGDLSKILELPFSEAREQLTKLPGVGLKTADVTLMFVASKKVIPVDRHITRISKRLEIVPKNANYEVIRKALEDASTPDRFREVHLSMIRFGREVCRALNPKCLECPLNNICPYPSKHH